jgi:hypothetical protein
VKVNKVNNAIKRLRRKHLLVHCVWNDEERDEQAMHP